MPGHSTARGHCHCRHLKTTPHPRWPGTSFTRLIHHPLSFTLSEVTLLLLRSLVSPTQRNTSTKHLDCVIHPLSHTGRYHSTNRLGPQLGAALLRGKDRGDTSPMAGSNGRCPLHVPCSNLYNFTIICFHLKHVKNGDMGCH